MSTETNQNLIDRLFSAGSHFGFSKSRRHPTMAKFLFGNKQGNDIFDLEKTSALLEVAKEALLAAGKDGKTVLFVSTKEEVAPLVKAAAEKTEMPYVTNRWIGGILTNYSEIKKRIERLKTLIEQGESGELERKYTKKERVVIGRERDKLNFNFGGIKDMDRTPALMVIVDPRHDVIAATEAKDMNVPVVGIMSSDNDAKVAAYPVVVNDALTASVSTVLDELTESYLEGRKAFVPKEAKVKAYRRDKRA